MEVEPQQEEKTPKIELLPPSKTLYIRNLNEKISISEMKETLMEIFSQYGEILQVVLKKNIRMRGQCFIVFSKEEEATAALEDCQEDELFDKNMLINYAKEKSDIVAKLDGTYIPKENREKKEVKSLPQKKVKTESNSTTQNPLQEAKAQTSTKHSIKESYINVRVSVILAKRNHPKQHSLYRKYPRKHFTRGSNSPLPRFHRLFGSEDDKA